MNFDFGEILSSAFKITWKHKIFWLFSALPVLVSFLIFPLIFVPVFFMDPGLNSEPYFLENPIYIVLFIGISIVISIFSFVLFSISYSAVPLGVIRADEGAEKFTFNELFNDSKKYWLRVLGVMLVISLGVSLVFMVIFGCMILFGAVTAGIGFICVMPIYLLLYPVMMVLYAYIEVSQVGVVVDDLGVTDAIKRGWELVRANFWRIVLISLIVYLGIGFLSGMLMFPLMAPFFFIPFLMDGGQGELNPRIMMLFMGGFSLLFLPVMALVQGITITFLKSTYTLVYLRLTGPQNNVPVVLEEKS